MLKFCRCRACRRGLRTSVGHATVKRVVRSNRRQTKDRLAKGIETDPKVSVPYTW